MSRDLVVALSGGIGGAKLALGLSRILKPDSLLVVANVGDDFEHLGLHISPDADTLMYTLAGLDNTKLGWGRARASPPSRPTFAAASASVPVCCRRRTTDCAPDCERMRDGSISRTISCAFSAARSCASLPSRAPRMRALILTFWQR